MSRKCHLSLALALVGLVYCAAGAQEGKSVDLFNGKDFTGWKIFSDPKTKSKADPKETWSVKDGVIDCKGAPNGYIITEKDYGDYVLELEWRWPGEKGGNSGVFLHVSGPDKIWPKGCEAQLFAGSAGDIWLVEGYKLEIDKSRQDPDPKRARHFFRMKKDEAIEKKVGEWNKYKITCQGDTIKLEVNGQVVNEGKNAESTKGKILLQSEGAPVQFRNVKLTPLK